MAARKRRGTKDNPWPEETKRRIKTSMLLNRLEDHVTNDEKANGPLMSATQITAATVLLRKVMPDMAASTLVADMTHKGLDTKAEKPESTKLKAFAAAYDSPSEDAESTTKH